MNLWMLIAVLQLITVSVRTLNEEEDFEGVGFPTETFYSDGNTTYKHHRMIRSNEDICKIPESMKTARLQCYFYPAHVKCIQVCVFGYGYDEGLQRTMRCKYEDDKWTPTKTFQECKPYIDCEVKIVGGGKSKCYKNFMTKPNYCDISCPFRYETHDPLPKERYTCNMWGRWSPKLPFCAHRSGMKLISPKTVTGKPGKPKSRRRRPIYRKGKGSRKPRRKMLRSTRRSRRSTRRHS